VWKKGFQLESQVLGMGIKYGNGVKRCQNISMKYERNSNNKKGHCEEYLKKKKYRF
jgi:hypothetical protein